MASNKTKGIIAGASAMAAAVAILVANNGAALEGSYEINNVNPYKSEVKVTTPEDFKPDIVVLKMNDMEISKTLLPNGIISTYPLAVSDTECLSMDMYIRGELAATAEFENNGLLKIALNEDAVNTKEGDTNEK